MSKSYHTNKSTTSRDRLRNTAKGSKLGAIMAEYRSSSTLAKIADRGATSSLLVHNKPNVVSSYANQLNGLTYDDDG
mgnify:CR=1 FL=1